MSTQPYANPDWSLVPGHTVLILIDLQNDVLSNDGVYAQNGIDITHMQRVIEPTKRLLDGARAKGVPVIWTRHGFHNQVDAGVFWESRPFLRAGGFRPGTWGHEILGDYEVLADEWIIDKRRMSAFFNTELETILKGLAAETLLISGVLTNQCVAGTTRDAQQMDYKAIMIEECCGTTLPDLHDPTIRMCEVGWGAVWSIDTVLKAFQGLPEPATRVA